MVLKSSAKFLNKLPFRGRGLFFLGGAFVGGGGGLAGYSLRQRSLDASRPPLGQQGNDNNNNGSAVTTAPMFGTGKQWTWWFGWRPVELKIVDSVGVLLIDPTPRRHDEAGTCVRSNGRKATAFPLTGTKVTINTDEKQIKLTTGTNSLGD